jgi:glycosyltransferase involved in cell wall biosynthesis
MTIGICLPCRNEGAHLAEVVAMVPSIVDEIIVVSNCSTDDTVEVARSLGVTVLEDDRTIGGIGYGFAHMTAIGACQSDLIVGADSDGTYPFEDIEVVIAHLLDQDLDLVSCSRYPLEEGTKIPVGLRIGVSMLNLEVRLLYSRRIADILSGMWAMRNEVSPQLDLTNGDWNLSPEINLKALLNPNIRFGEFSIRQRERQGSSHQRYFHTGLGHAWWILRYRFGTASGTEGRWSRRPAARWTRHVNADRKEKPVPVEM